MMEPTRKQVRRAVWAVYISGARGADKIKEYLTQQFPGGFKASDRTIYRDCQELEARYTPDQRELDRPFQISTDLPAPFTKDDIPLYLAILRMSNTGDILLPLEGVTIRAMLWASLLRPTMEGDRADKIWMMAKLYASRERWAKIEGEELNTWDIDMLLAYAFWRSEANLRAFQTAVACGKAVGADDILFAHAADLYPLDNCGRGKLLKGIREAETHLNDPDLNNILSRVSQIEDSIPAAECEAFSIFFSHLTLNEGLKNGPEEFLRKLEAFAALLVQDSSNQQDLVALAEEGK